MQKDLSCGGERKFKGIEGDWKKSFHYFPFLSLRFFLFARAFFDNTDREKEEKTFIIFRSLFLSIVNKSFSLLGFRFSLPPTNPLEFLPPSDDEADVIAIVELSSFAMLLGV